MPTNPKKSILSDEMLLLSIGFAIVYWLLDAVFWVFAYVELGFFQHMFRSDLGEMGARIIVVCLFLIFGSHAQYTLKAKKRSEQEVARLKTKLEELQTELAELKEK